MPNIADYSCDDFRKWTVAIVNWKSLDWLNWQIKSLYEFNNPINFELIIFDGMFPKSELVELEFLCEPYKSFKNIKLLSWSTGDEKQSDFGSGNSIYHGSEHGDELTEILKIANSQYFLSNDPDYFWMIKDHLNFLEKFFIAGYGSVGAVNNYFDFVSIWAGAYRTEDIKGLSAAATWVTCSDCKKRFLVQGQDTGWQFRLKTQALPKFLFPQMIFNLPFKGPWSYPFDGGYNFYKAYHYEKLPIGLHFFRGQYPIEQTTAPLPDEWKIARQSYGKYFYDQCLNSDFNYKSCYIQPVG